MDSDGFYYMEDFQAGQKFRAGPVLVTAEEIIDFAKKYDPQDFHTDPEKAKDSIFGEHVASGWLTAALTMRLLLKATPPIKGGMIGRHVEKMNWPHPVKPEDRLTLETEILSIRNSSNPARGVARVKSTTYNQLNKSVLEMESIILLPRRNEIK